MFLKSVVLVFSISLVQAHPKYIVPEPEILVHQPRGFSVSIPNEPGIRLFAFHGSLNQELQPLQAGQFSKDIARTTNDKWTFQDRRTKLKIGDTIYYWLFVIKDNLGYRLDNGQFVVTDLIYNPLLQPHASRVKPSYVPLSMPNEQENEVNYEKDNTLCLQSIFNISEKYVRLQSQYEEFKKNNIIMKELIERMPNARQLTISGRIPPDGAASSTVSFILREKLSINPTISYAERKSDGSIIFEVSTLEDKLKILDSSKEKLQLTKILIQ